MNAIIQRLKSKTYWAALIGAILSAVEVNSGFIGSLMPENYRAWAIMFWPVMMIVLREMTTAALSDKPAAPAK